MDHSATILNDHLGELTINDRGYGIVDAFAAVQLAQNLSSIDKSYLYDAFSVVTPHELLEPYVSFYIQPAYWGQGIGITAVKYNFWSSGSLQTISLLFQLSVWHVWKDSTYLVSAIHSKKAL
ncbi:MAG: hypothetical protein QXL57_01300 [Candidatus Bathyarchaeia archaeon]